MNSVNAALPSAQRSPALRWAWQLLVLPPFVHLAAFAAVFIAAALARPGGLAALADPAAQQSLVDTALPYSLLVLQLVLLGLIVWAVRAGRLSLGDLGWKLGAGQAAWREVLIGLVPGALLGLLYPTVLTPILTGLQRLGDYVPAGAVLTSVGALALPFFLADVVLAPFVEETIYRGLGLSALGRRFGAAGAAAISMVCFGLLHWLGGFWYVLLVGLAAGGLFTALRLWRGNLAAPFAAHLAVNVIEFAFTLLLVRH